MSTTVMRDYSQAGEQEAILAWAGDRHGSFLDLGSYDGESYSNTAALADLGWPGICIDAAPDAAGACAIRYANRADVCVILAAFSVADDGGTEVIYWSPGAMYSAMRASRRPDVQLVPIEVPVIDLHWLSDRVRWMPHPLFCSIDLEGASVDALRWVLEWVGPECVCVEANNPGERAAVRGMLDDWTEIPLRGNHVNLLFVVAS